jgi:diguanylate cyclase (GGDEF)-like protein
VLLIDIDHFKAYNDRYGHQAGDLCLQQVASAIRSSVARRPLDMVARYGGEEIVAILPGADRAHAADVAAAILKAVADLQIAHGASTTRPHVTVSVGVTTVDPGGDYSHEHAVRLADLALYSIKARGRDGWSFYEPAEQAVDHQPELLKTAS